MTERKYVHKNKCNNIFAQDRIIRSDQRPESWCNTVSRINLKFTSANWKSCCLCLLKTHFGGGSAIIFAPLQISFVQIED